MTADLTRVNEGYGTFSERFPILYDREGRTAKAKKIVAVMADFSAAPLSRLRVLDIGGSAGVMTEVFAANFAEVVELDIDHVAVRRGRDDCESANVSWLCGDATRLPFAAGSFDCIICNHVYEHLDAQEALAAEVSRILSPSGFCYFSAGSRFVLIEGHYKLPFLSWLPHRLADIYMRICGKQQRYDVRLLSFRRLKRLLHDFIIHDYTIPILTDPQRFAAGDLQDGNRLAFRVPAFFYRLSYQFLPIWIWILSKK
jgi:SAM-dependent methyltransferase